MKTPYLSINQRFLLFIIGILLFSLNQTANAEGLSGLKDILNKGKINKNNAPDVPIIPDTGESSNDLTPVKNKRIIDDNVKTPEFTFVNKNRLEGKANLTKNKKETSEKFNKDLINDCNKMLASLKSTKKKKTGPVIAAVRIEDDLDGSIPSQLPEDFLINIDTDELAIRTDIKNLYDSFESLSLVDFNKTCESLLFRYRNSRADICHLISLIKSDAQLKKDPNSALEKQTIRKLIWPTHYNPIPPYPSFDFFSLYEQYLKINRDTSFGNELTKFVNKEADIRLNKIKKANDNIFPAINNEIKSLNKLKADYEAYIKKLLSLKHIVPGSTSQYENNPDYLQRVMKYAIDDIKSYYLKISQAYIKIAIVLNAAGQWEESLKLTEEYKDYFDKNMPYKFTIKFAGQFDYDAAANSGNLGNLKIIEGDLLINKDNLLWGKKRMDQAAFECVSRLSLQNVTDQLNSEEFRNKIIKFAETNITDPAEIEEYKIEPKIERIYFTESEYSSPINPKKIFDADERICVKVVLNTYNRFYQRPIEVTLKSSESGRNKIVKTTPRRGDGLPYALFQPNETNDPEDKTKNLINTGKDSQMDSVAVAEAAHLLYNIGQIYNSTYFKKRLGYGDFKQTTHDIINNHFKLSIPFLKSGGVELINCTDDNIKSVLLVRNQADVVVIAGHGNERTGSIGMEDKGSLDDVIIRPIKDVDAYNASIGHHKIYGLLRNDGTSEYDEDVDVLILSGCSILAMDKNIIAWHRVLPDGLILSYNGRVKASSINSVIGKMANFFNSFNNTISKPLVLQKWKEYNLQEIIGFTSIFSSRYDGILTFAYVTNNICVQHYPYRVPFNQYLPYPPGKIKIMQRILKIK